MEPMVNRDCPYFSTCNLREGRLSCDRCSCREVSFERYVYGGRSSTSVSEYIYGRRNQVDFLLESIELLDGGELMSRHTALAYVRTLACDPSDDPYYATMIHVDSFNLPDSRGPFLKGGGQFKRYTNWSRRMLYYQIGSGTIAVDRVGGVILMDVKSAEAIRTRKFQIDVTSLSP